MKKCPKCGKKYGDIYNRCMQCYIPLEKVGETITVQCPACNKQSELEIEPSSGIKLRCPYCSTKFEYSTSHRVNPNPRDQADNLAKNVSSGGWESAFSIASLFVSLSSLIAKNDTAPIIVAIGAALIGLAIGRGFVEKDNSGGCFILGVAIFLLLLRALIVLGRSLESI